MEITCGLCYMDHGREGEVRKDSLVSNWPSQWRMFLLLGPQTPFSVLRKEASSDLSSSFLSNSICPQARNLGDNKRQESSGTITFLKSII